MVLSVPTVMGLPNTYNYSNLVAIPRPTMNSFATSYLEQPQATVIKKDDQVKRMQRIRRAKMATPDFSFFK